MFAGASKPFASLSSGLLARKGQAKPAMRSQLMGGFSSSPPPQDDLGWNDMGTGEAQAEPIAASPASKVPEAAPMAQAEQAAEVATPAVPPVLLEREALKEEIEAVRPVKSVSVATATRLARESAAQTKGGKAAFTLRLDNERHLRLRLASALTGQSAQGLVTAALDGLLRSLPDVELLVEQLPPARKRLR